MGTWDEKAGKSVGRSVPTESTVAESSELLKTISRLVPPGICPKGVFRFKSFEEADEWAMTQAARNPAFRK